MEPPRTSSPPKRKRRSTCGSRGPKTASGSRESLPLERSSGGAKLFEQARKHGRELGLELQEASSGGGSDGNIVGALGVPVLDGLGEEGGGAHAPEEHVLLDSLPIRAELLARL